MTSQEESVLSPKCEATALKLYVLDTSVLMSNPEFGLFSFAEHDVHVPAIVRRELNTHRKSSVESKAYAARTAVRTLNKILDTSGNPKDGISLAELSDGKATGRLFFQTSPTYRNYLKGFEDSPDNQIINVAMNLCAKFEGRTVVLVSQDIDMRSEALIVGDSLGLLVEDYRRDIAMPVIESEPHQTNTYTGVRELPSNFFDTHEVAYESSNPRSNATVKGPLVPSLWANQFLHMGGENPFSMRVCGRPGDTASLRPIIDYSMSNNAVCGIVARNAEQNYMLNLLGDCSITHVIEEGPAGSGKTLLAIAMAVYLVVIKGKYERIIVTKPTIPLGESLGYFKGTKYEKMLEWMKPIYDNLGILGKRVAKLTEWRKILGSKTLTEYLEFNELLELETISVVRGRTLENIILIVDETQNSPRKELVTLLTRIGSGSRVFTIGDRSLDQIDHPTLTPGTCGLAHIIRQLHGEPTSSHLFLPDVERSAFVKAVVKAFMPK